MFKRIGWWLAGVPLVAAAQYKVVEPDGHVTYTDRPPASGQAKVTEMRRASVSPVEPQLAALPIELRQVAQRFPVVLYAVPDCPPCDNGRQLLTQRGVPFTEKRVATEDDAQAMERALGWRTVPSLTIGAQALRGMAGDEWLAYLDAAGYPRESRLRRAAAVAASAAAKPPADVASAAPSERPRP